MSNLSGSHQFANKYYSLNEEYKDKTVSVLGDGKIVSIYYQGKLLEVHERVTDPNQSKSTKPQHLKPWERAMLDDSIYRQRAVKIGPAVDAVILAILKQGHGFVDTRKVWGILSLDKSYAAEKINWACEKALKLGLLSFRAVRGLLEAQKDREDAEAAVTGQPPKTAASAHKFVRPLSDYEEQLSLYLH